MNAMFWRVKDETDKNYVERFKATYVDDERHLDALSAKANNEVARLFKTVQDHALEIKDCKYWSI